MGILKHLKYGHFQTAQTFSSNIRPILQSYRNQIIHLHANHLAGFYMNVTLVRYE